MVQDLNLANTIFNEFMRAHYFKDVHLDYMAGARITHFGELQKNGYCPIELQEGETGEDLCFQVTVKRKPPATFALPKTYKGFRIFYEIREEQQVIRISPLD